MTLYYCAPEHVAFARQISRKVTRHRNIPGDHAANFEADCRDMLAEPPITITPITTPSGNPIMSFASVQFGAPEAATAPVSNASNTARVVGAAIERRADGTVAEKGDASINFANVSNGADGILGTARGSGGSWRAASDIKPSDTVQYGGMEISVAVAERMGLLQRDASGRYQESAHASDVIPESGTELDPMVSAQALAGGAEDVLGTICQGATPGVQMRGLMELTDTGSLSTNTLNAAATEMGIHPNELRGRVEQVLQGFHTQAARSVERLGCEDAEHFFAWAHANKGQAMQDAMRKHGTERSTAAYGPLYQAYVEDMANHSPDAILSAEFGDGVKAYQRDGRILVNVPGFGELPFQSAVRAELIRVRAK